MMSDEKKIIVVDTETTGLDPKHDELLQVSIIDINGNVLYDGLFKPKASSWESAMKVNHITPEMVQDAPRISEKIAEINDIMYGSDAIIGYNTNFDLNFLRFNGLVLNGSEKIIDVMEMFSEEHGEQLPDGRYKWVKLTQAAEYYNYDWVAHEEKAHNAVGDCFATLHVYKHLLGEDISEMGVQEAMDLLWEMHENCLKGDIYEDPKRYQKARAIYKAIEALRSDHE
jgi:DNA polymerase-3 subunit epsilon